MSGASDFGYSQIEWEKASRENVMLVEAEYRQRFEGTLAGNEDLDKKAQYVLTGLIGLITAILGLAFSQARNMDIQYLIGLFTLASTFGLASIFASVSLYPRPYAHLGTTPADLNVGAWAHLLNGNEKDALRLYGVRIKEYSRAISNNALENAKKSRWLKLALIATVLAFPASIAATASVALFDVSKPAVAAPVASVPVSPP
jgi:hypothetical protein